MKQRAPAKAWPVAVLGFETTSARRRNFAKPLFLLGYLVPLTLPGARLSEMRNSFFSPDRLCIRKSDRKMNDFNVLSGVERDLQWLVAKTAILWLHLFFTNSLVEVL